MSPFSGFRIRERRTLPRQYGVSCCNDLSNPRPKADNGGTGNTSRDVPRFASPTFRLQRRTVTVRPRQAVGSIPEVHRWMPDRCLHRCSAEQAESCTRRGIAFCHAPALWQMEARIAPIAAPAASARTSRRLGTRSGRNPCRTSMIAPKAVASRNPVASPGNGAIPAKCNARTHSSANTA